MAQFRYKGRSDRGDLIEGDLEAATADAVASQLINTGITPIDIRERPAAARPWAELAARLGARPPELNDLILFSRQMYTLMRAGVPINRAMTGLVRSTRNPALAEALKDVQAHIESGHDLSSAFARHPRIFSTLFVSMVRVGENTGRLEEALLRIANYLDLEKETRERVKAALRYPAMVIVAIAIAMAIINIFVVPAFAQVFARANVELPLPTRVLMATSEFFVNFWPLMLVGLIALVLGLRYYVHTEPGRYRWDKIKLRLPIVGDILRRAMLGRFARAFSMALASGVPLIQALTVCARAVDNEYIAEHVLRMRNGIERGETLTRTAAATGLFTPLVLQMLAVGEETGSIDDLMAEVAGFYEREVDYDIRNLSQTIEPILIVVIAGMVLVLALGVFLPMWDLASVSLRR